MGLDERGDIAILEIIVYTPILVSSGFLIFRHGLTRNAGWIFLLILSIVRIVGGSIHLASEVGDPDNITLRIVFGILEAAGLSPLLLATIGFLRTIAERAFEGKVTRLLHAFGLLSGIALALSITGGTKLANAHGDQTELDQGTTFKHVGAILFLVLYVLVVIMHGIYWLRRHEIMKNRRKLLLGVSAALPFLFLRLLYSVLSAYAPINPNDKSGLANFNSSTGKWYIYLIMGVLAELIVVLIYTFVGITVPLQEDYKSTRMEHWEGEEPTDKQHMLPYGP